MFYTNFYYKEKQPCCEPPSRIKIISPLKLPYFFFGKINTLFMKTLPVYKFYLELKKSYMLLIPFLMVPFYCSMFGLFCTFNFGVCERMSNLSQSTNLLTPSLVVYDIILQYIIPLLIFITQSIIVHKCGFSVFICKQNNFIWHLIPSCCY